MLRNVFKFLHYASVSIEVFNSYLRISHVQRHFKKQTARYSNKATGIYTTGNGHTPTYLRYFIVTYYKAF